MFIGEKEIDKEVVLKNNLTEVYYKPVEKDGETKTFSNEIFKTDSLSLLKTEEPTDANFVRETMCTPVMTEVLSILLNHNVKYVDVDYILTNIINSLNAHKKTAVEKLIGQHEFDVTTGTIDRILKDGFNPPSE